jgi:hypothetical protein
MFHTKPRGTRICTHGKAAIKNSIRMMVRFKGTASEEGTRQHLVYTHEQRRSCTQNLVLLGDVCLAPSWENVVGSLGCFFGTEHQGRAALLLILRSKKKTELPCGNPVRLVGCVNLEQLATDCAGQAEHARAHHY